MHISEPDSAAVIIGQITSGFIPLTEIRDTLGNLYNEDYLFAGINLSGLVFCHEDIMNFSGRVIKFVKANIKNLPEIEKVFEFMARNCPELLEELCKNDEVVKAVKEAVDTNTTKLTKREAEALESTLREAGVEGSIKW